ncbi:unnamed protein product [Urochloa humidicola]
MDGESVEDFALRMQSMQATLQTLGEPVTEVKVVEKIPRSVPSRFRQIVVAIRTLLDVSTLSVADLIGRLKASEDTLEGPPASLQHDGKLYMTAEEWESRRKKSDGERTGGGSGNSGGRGGGRSHGRGRGRGNFGSPSSRGPGNSPGKVGRDQCRRCGKTGHWARECPQKPRKEAAHVVQDEEEASLLMVRSTPFSSLTTATLSSPPAKVDGVPALQAEDPGARPEEAAEAAPEATLLVAIPTPPGEERSDPDRAARPPCGAVAARAAAGSSSQVRLVKHKVLVHLSEEEKNRNTRSWVLDTGATNHMSGARVAFANLNTAVRGTVSFGDGSVAAIEGCGNLLFSCKSGEHRSFAGVYYIPRLTSNIISLGQLDEAGYKISIDGGVLQIRDQGRKLLVRVSHRPNRLYVLELDVARPVCLAARGKEEAWRWHARMGHVNMSALRKMSREEMVRGLPAIEQVDQLCDACLVGKQRRNSFPAVAQYRAERTLELVHGDLCGAITLETPSGGKYFLLLVDDKSRFMWLKVLARKDQAAAAIREFQARAEAESGLKLGALRTDRAGEFTSIEFTEYCAGEGVRRQLTAPYSPQQNGVVERRNGTVVAIARSMLKAKGLPGWFWGEAVNTAVYVLNRCPTKSVEGMTPFEA